MSEGREVRLTFQPDWDPGPADPGRGGLLARDPKVRTLLKVLVSYPEVHYVLPDRIRLDPASDPRLLDTIQRFLERQSWLLRAVTVR
ncbi:MAG TPA: hypothetical protein VFX14_16320 [Methylomirabilota bacterium]|jgi:hypothetical protein|nr:hypothetical protein [Methylomirabilota bacterium]